MEAQLNIGERITFRTASGEKHFGTIEDYLPDIEGGAFIPSASLRSVR